MSRVRRALFIAMISLSILNGCVTQSSDEVALASPPPIQPEVIQSETQQGQNYAVIKTFFATDRNVTGSNSPDKFFGNNRSKVSYGICRVSIPRDHRMGELESSSILKLYSSGNPEKEVVLLDTAITSKSAFFSELTKSIQSSPESNAFVFVHGYNVTFSDAARRTAQIAYDLGFNGAPVFYSWPSKGSLHGYFEDEQDIEWAETNLKIFLGDFFRNSDAQNIYVIAHSMGNRALTRAIVSLMKESPDLKSKLKEVILTAPDIDAEVFTRDIAPALTSTGRPVTLYVSSKDNALIASQKVHKYPRAGYSGKGLVIVPGVETIDASYVNTSLIGHSYFGDNISVISDMMNLIRYDKSAAQRSGLRPVDTKNGRYWELKPSEN